MLCGRPCHQPRQSALRNACGAACTTLCTKAGSHPAWLHSRRFQLLMPQAALHCEAVTPAADHTMARIVPASACSRSRVPYGPHQLLTLQRPLHTCLPCEGVVAPSMTPAMILAMLAIDRTVA